MEQRKAAVERLLSGYRRYYTITRFDGIEETPGEGLREAVHLEKPVLPCGAELSAVCEYYEKAEKYFLFHSNQLWSTHQEEFLFIFAVPHLTMEVFEQCKEYAYNAGMDMAHIGSGHMYTYISPVFLCDSVDEDARKALEKCKYYKTFRFSFHGWMEYHAGCVDLSTQRLYFNKAGRCMEKGLKEVLHIQEKRGIKDFFRLSRWGEALS